MIGRLYINLGCSGEVNEKAATTKNPGRFSPCLICVVSKGFVSAVMIDMKIKESVKTWIKNHVRLIDMVFVLVGILSCFVGFEKCGRLC